MCQHPHFKANVSVAVLEDIGKRVAELTIECALCGRPFQFQGLSPGLHLNGASVSLDGLTAHLAIVPQGEAASPLQQMSGTEIN